MFGLLNPALTPIKAKLTIAAVAVITVLLLGAAATCYFLWGSLDAAKKENGALQVNLAHSVQTANDNAKEWDIQRANFEDRIKRQKNLIAIADRAAKLQRAREAALDRALDIALDTLKETADDDPESAEWSVVRLPDGIVDGMCRAAAAASNEAADCGDDPVRGGDDPGEPARRVPDQPAS